MKKILAISVFVMIAMVNVVVLSPKDGESKQTLKALIGTVFADGEFDPNAPLKPMKPKHPEDTGDEWCGEGFGAYQVPTCGGDGCVTTGC